MIRLCIFKNGHSPVDGFTPLWENIYEHMQQHEALGYYKDIDTVLAEWGGRRSSRGSYVCFDNDEDLTAFMLRWS